MLDGGAAEEVVDEREVIGAVEEEVRQERLRRKRIGEGVEQREKVARIVS